MIICQNSLQKSKGDTQRATRRPKRRNMCQGRRAAISMSLFPVPVSMSFISYPWPGFSTILSEKGLRKDHLLPIIMLTLTDV